jgi:glutathione synthase/RimK-type ligase-like ATP-grasp enzyme
MRIAIHHRKGSFSERWIEYCNEKSIPYEVVSCYDSKIVARLRAFDALLWHWHQNDTKAILFARQLIASLQHMGITVFPDISTCWHFDDKVGQKYLLEAIGAPLVPSYVFYDKEEALAWVAQADFPKVFKLRGGAGSTNVRLVRDRAEAARLCRTAFGRGFKPVAGYFADFSHRIRRAHEKRDYLGKLKRLPRSLWNIAFSNRMRGREKGYIYFQDFVPENNYDTRVVIIGNRAFAFRRMVRKRDFRASGSAQVDFDISRIDMRCIQIAFHVAKKLGMQSMASDFVLDGDGAPRLLEISYCFVTDGAVRNCPGHWDKDLNWHDGKMLPQDAILEDVLAQIKLRAGQIPSESLLSLR